jgi:DNA ligase (NAD+)
VLQSHNPAPEEVAALRLFPFQLLTAGAVRSDQAALQLLSDWGFPVAFNQTRSVRTFDQIQSVYRDYLVRRAHQPFAMDGIVVKLDDLALRQQLGEGERAPLWAAAWKFPPHTTQTRVRSIRWTVGRTGRRTPIAELVPVRLGGVLVSRASLHTGAGVARLDIAAGDQVVVGLVGDVIPQVLEVVAKTSRDQRADAPLLLSEPALDACLQDAPGCREQFLSRAVFFTSSSGLAIRGLGRKRLHKLIEAGLVDDLPSLFLLKTGTIAAVPGFGIKMARQIVAEIKAAAHPEPFRLLAALGIPGVGPKAVQALAHQFSSLDALLSADLKQPAALSADNERALRTVRRFFQSPGGKKLLAQFRKQGVV